jgi:phosphate uptake regulator/aminoglycoside phosphotransferase
MFDDLGSGGIAENLRFLIIEVSRQIERTLNYLQDPSPGRLDAIRERDDYIDHLRNIIHRQCFIVAPNVTESDGTTLDLLKNTEVVATNLERIADFCENIVQQKGFIENDSLLDQQRLAIYFNEVFAGLSLTSDAVFNLDTNLALRICRTEDNLDRLYREDLTKIIESLKTGRNAPSFVTCMFIFHYLERMGDSLLNIGEAILSAKLGERIKIGQLRTLEESLAAADFEPSLGAISLDHVADTKSGSRIDRVSPKGRDDKDPMLIFKGGRRRKLLEERDGILRWDELIPGLTPEIYAFSEKEDTGALLFEFLPGETLEKLLLSSGGDVLDAALAKLATTLTLVWERTRQNEAISAGFSNQLLDRLDDVYALHPNFQDEGANIGALEVASFGKLVQQACQLEEHLRAPFSVLIHGDFNVDNIIYDPSDHRIRFIDLHRTAMADYAQDVSVFLVSNYRLQVIDAPVRRRIDKVILAFFDFASDFARHVQDSTFQIRLALGLARSFATSARFVLDDKFANTMFQRSRYLLEQVVACGAEDGESFRINREVLVD